MPMISIVPGSLDTGKCWREIVTNHLTLICIFLRVCSGVRATSFPVRVAQEETKLQYSVVYPHRARLRM